SSIEGFTPTGTVTYSFYDNNTCTGSPATTQTVTLSGGAVPNSDPTGPLATGSYGYQAAWSGDSNYASAIGECEGFSVLEAATATSTIVYDAALGAPWSGTETTGASAYDTATVTAPAAPLTDVGRRRHLAPRATGIAATGQVTYDFFENATCNGEAFSTATVTLAAGAAPDSSATAPLGAGSYSFQATYAGDANYHPSTSGCEPFSVGPVLTATSTIVYDTSHGVPWNGTEATGASAYDTATVVGVPGFVPTGTVTYDFFANGTCGLPASTTDAVTLSDGTVPNSSATSPLGADGYSFDATYSGDVNDLPETSSCEAFSVAKAASSTRSAVYDAATRKVWSGTEDQGAAAYDRATVTGVAGFAPAGTLTYRLFPNSFCSGTVSSFQTVTVAGGHVPASAVTGSLPPARYSYRATYSGSNEYDASTGTCESFRTLAVGYRVEGGDGGVFDFHVPFYGSVPGLGYRDLFNFVGMADSSKGYWLVESNGGIFHFGNAHSYGSLPQRGKTVDNIVGMAATPNGRGYWMVASDGTVYRFGNAAAHGSLSSRGIHVNDIVAIESPDAGGYWLVGANGTVYGFGDAHYRGSCLQANSGCKGISDIVGIADAGSSGYWLVSQNGRVFSFGAVKSHGSCGQAASGCAGAHNVIGIASPDVGGYWLAEANGKVIGFGDAKLFGDEVGKGLTRPLVAIA
ncbi:MAG: Ig-like domain-containing protein, partial [Acidimicrobiales bacterium]